MKNFFKSFTFKGLVMTALFLVGMMAYSISTGGKASIPETIIGSIVTPIQSLGTAISDGIYNFIGVFTDSGQLREENEKLSGEVEKLREAQVELDELRRLNESYAKLLEIKDRNPDFQFEHARIMSTDITEKYGNFSINRGSLQNVKVGDPVTVGKNLVGVVYKVGPNYANVRTILDPGTQVTAYVSSNNVSGVTGGMVAPAAEGQIRLNYLSRDNGMSIPPGSYVVTSGQGGIYPSGLLIGQVESVQPESHGTTMFALITPFADMSQLDYVAVITSFAGQGETGK